MKPLSDLGDEEFAPLVQRAAALPDAPAELVRSAIALFPARTTSTLDAVLVRVARLVVATLSFDSWAAPAFATGMRSNASDIRQLLFTSDGRDVDLRITGSPASTGPYAMTGQVLGVDESGVVELVLDEPDATTAPAVRCTPLDAFGGFHLDALEGGNYAITLRFADGAVRLPSIRIGGR